MVQSETTPDGAVIVGHDFNSGRGLDAIMGAMLTSGFQATALGQAVEEVNRMVRACAVVVCCCVCLVCVCVGGGRQSWRRRRRRQSRLLVSPHNNTQHTTNNKTNKTDQLAPVGRAGAP